MNFLQLTCHWIKHMIIVFAFVCTFLYLPVPFAYAEGKRGEAPQCDQECLAHHSEKMNQLSQEYLKTKDKMSYQDKVQEEVSRYTRCLTNCREVLPVK